MNRARQVRKGVYRLTHIFMPTPAGELRLDLQTQPREEVTVDVTLFTTAMSASSCKPQPRHINCIGPHSRKTTIRPNLGANHVRKLSPRTIRPLLGCSCETSILRQVSSSSQPLFGCHRCRREVPQRPNTRPHNLLASSTVKVRDPRQLRIVVENSPALTAEVSCPRQLREVWFSQGGDRGGVGGLLIRDPVSARASVVGTCPWYAPRCSFMLVHVCFTNPFYHFAPKGLSALRTGRAIRSGQHPPENERAAFSCSVVAA